MKPIPFYWGRLGLTLAAVSAVFVIGLTRLNIETDILAFMPKDDPVLSDGIDIFEHHPIQDQMIIDVSLSVDNPDLLLENGLRVEQAMRQSGLFNSVGLQQFQTLMPELAFHILNQLPFMFSAEMLDAQINPLLDPGSIHQKLTQTHRSLLNLDGIGQTAFIAQDPLGLKDLVMARLAGLVPTRSAQVRKGQIISADGRHLLVIAESSASGTDTLFARKVTDLIADIDRQLNPQRQNPEPRVTLMPLGAYRFALDNELIVRKDVHRAILFATLGIVLLLIFTFPRPYLGLLSLLPAVAGAAMALLILSLLHKTVALMVLGFGGALISISVDHGIAYLLFLDRTHETYGREASREVWALGLIAAMTTVGAFAVLSISGFPILVQLGQFTALGVGFSFLFVHFVFPRIFTAVPPAKARKLPLQKLVDRFARAGKTGAILAAGLTCLMFFFAKPEFNVDLSAMNTVSAETHAAEAQITRIWGKADQKVFLKIEASGIAELQDRGDRLLALVERQQKTAMLAPGFVPSMVFPGPELQHRNLAAWQAFWDSRRIETLKLALSQSGAEVGFSASAFEPFYRLIAADSPELKPLPMPQIFFGLMGVIPGAEGKPWRQISTVTTGPKYKPANFYEDFRSIGSVFDPNFFSEKLGQELFATFLKMLAIIGISVTVLLLFFFFDLGLTLIALLPVVFALICTLGTLKLIGHALDLPGLILAIVVIGMGIDYSLFLVRAHQRYGDASDPNFGLIRTAVILASVSTIIGFGVLATAHHALLRSAGITSLLGIAYALLGAFLILPPLLQRRLRISQVCAIPAADAGAQVLGRYRQMEAYPRIFARFKLRYDPMFAELPAYLQDWKDIRTIMDIGCGYGVPACWMLTHFKTARIFGIDPDPGRVLVAARAVGDRGVIETGGAPEIPAAAPAADLAMLLDIIHFLDDDILAKTLSRIRNRLQPGGHLILRATITPVRPFPWVWWFENFKLWLRGIPSHYRSRDVIRTTLVQAGYRIEQTGDSGADHELAWFIAAVEA